MTEKRFYKRDYIKSYNLRVNWIKSMKDVKFHHHFHHTHQIIDSQNKIPIICSDDYSGYLVEKYNEWDTAILDNRRFFTCHNDNGHFQIVDIDESDPYSNKWKIYKVPKRETAMELCELLNSLWELKE